MTRLTAADLDELERLLNGRIGDQMAFLSKGQTLIDELRRYIQIDSYWRDRHKKDRETRIRIMSDEPVAPSDAINDR
jgi:hypothetical protein